MNPHKKEPEVDTGCATLKPVVFCADDFGKSRAIDAGIIELAHEGCLSAASCMTKGATFRADASGLAGTSVQKGLHLNLTEPLDGGAFWQPLGTLVRNCFLGRIDRKGLEREIEEQLDAFEAAFGMHPDYVDGHQHVHQFPIVRNCLFAALERRYGALSPWLRSTVAPRRMRAIPIPFQLKARLIEALGARTFREQASRKGFPTNGHLLGVYDFAGGGLRYAQLLDAWLAIATPFDLIMCHPANAVDADDPLGIQRHAEYAVLLGRPLAESLDRHKAFVAR